MEWPLLLSTKRYEMPAAPLEAQRTAFQRDFDRIVFSAAFRRLQDKTQVHPFPESDYVRRRLTHSLEVSCVGRSLGTAAGTYVQEHQPELIKEMPNLEIIMGQVTANACLAHDIGNPPFGHAGEKAIGEWFECHLPSDLAKSLNKNQRADLNQFEGNAQGYRLLCRLQERRNGGGLRLSYASLAAFTKYPTTASKTGKENGYIGAKKHGFFCDDVDLFKDVAEAVGLIRNKNGWCRHPLVFLMEAADDICYRVIDIEDAFKLGRFSFEEAEGHLSGMIGASKYRASGNNNEDIGWLRAKAIGNLIEEVAAAFAENYREIMTGRFSKSLIDCGPSHENVKSAFDDVKKKIFKWERTISAEIAGAKMIADLLDQFVNALRNPGRYGNQKLLSIVPFFEQNLNTYSQILCITDFVSGMTDSYLQRIHRRLTAQSIY